MDMALEELERLLRDFALQLPETDEAFPWGERALRVRGKAFVFMRLEEGELSFSVKLPHSRAQALALSFVEPTHYGLGRHGWVTIQVPRPTEALVRQFKDWIIESFRAVAPKRVSELLDAASSQASSPRPVKRSRTARPRAKS
jgi:predicted DNA-binding protein (MmcQ/YjbR family)